MIEVHYAHSADVDGIRKALEQNGYTDFAVQNFGSSRDVLVRLPPLGEKESANAVTAKIESALKAVDQGVTVIGAAVSPRGGDKPGTGRDTHSPTAFVAR